jgi:hypothetical protein
MLRTLGATALLSLALAMPAQQAPAQDALGGAIFGGAAGAIIGGVAGGGRGAAIGAAIGATTGAIIGAEGERRRGGYYYWRNGCYIQRPDGVWIRVSPGYCGPVAYEVPPPPPPGDPVAYCMQRYRSYDPVTQTYMGYDGIRRPCP